MCVLLARAMLAELCATPPLLGRIGLRVPEPGPGHLSPLLLDRPRENMV